MHTSCTSHEQKVTNNFFPLFFLGTDKSKCIDAACLVLMYVTDCLDSSWMLIILSLVICWCHSPTRMKFRHVIFFYTYVVYDGSLTLINFIPLPYYCTLFLTSYNFGCILMLSHLNIFFPPKIYCTIKQSENVYCIFYLLTFLMKSLLD